MRRFLERNRWRLGSCVSKRPALILNRAREIRLLVAGQDKAATLRAMLQGPHDPRRTPVQLIEPENGRVIWLVDGAA